MKPNEPVSNEATHRHPESEAQVARALLTESSTLFLNEPMHELQLYQAELEMQNEELRAAQSALEESRDRYVDLYEFAPVGYLTLTRTGQISETNLAGATLLGVGRNISMQHRFDFFVAPVDRDRWQLIFVSVMRHAEKMGIELTLQRSDGSALHAHLDCLRIGVVGAPPEMRIALTDISAMQLNKQLSATQDDLREQLAFQASLLESVPIPIFFKDCQGRYLGCNHAYEESVGKSRAEIIGKSVFDMVPSEIAEKYHSMDTELLQRPGKQMYEWVIRKPSGELHEVVFHKATFLRSDGNVGGLIGAVMDITELKRKDAALRESEERLRAASETTRDAIIVIEAESAVITAWNLAAEVIFGYTRADVIGQVLHDFLTPPRFREMAHRGLSIFTNSGEGTAIGKTLELTALRKDGTEFPIELSLSAMQIYGKWYATGIARDITERKAAEEKIQRLTQFYAALSHCNEAIVRCANEEDLFREICRDVVQFGGMKMAWIGLVDESGQRVKPVISYGDGIDYLNGIQISMDAGDPLGRGPTGTAIRESKPFWCQDFPNDPLTAPWHESGASHGWGAAASLPLYRNGVAIGAFTLYTSETDAFDEAARKLLTEMAMDISFALGNFAHEAERKLAEEQLRESEARYKRITEGLTDYQYTVRVENSQAVDTLQSTGCVTVTGYMAEDFAADPYLWIQIVTPDDRGRVREYVQHILAGKNIPPIEYRIIRKDGETRWVSDTTILFKDTLGNLRSYDGVIKDITERIAAEEQIQRYVAQLESAFMRTALMAGTLGEMRDPYTAGHERRVAEIAAAIGSELGLDAQRVEGLRIAGQLHDIGKISIPAEILAKPGIITATEYMLIKEHPKTGYDALKDVGFPWPVAEVAWQHHERMDGSGYPRGLKGDEILLEARIMSVADVVEAMASHRPYRPGHGIEKALEEIERGSGSAYDTAVVEACLRLFREKGYALPS